MSKVLIFDGITEDTISPNLERLPGKLGVFIELESVGHGRIIVESSADGGSIWITCRIFEDASDAVFTSSGYFNLSSHGGNTLMRAILDNTDGETTPITVYITTDEL